MNTGRFEELLGQLFDGDLSAAEGDELAAMLRADPSRRRELRQHLVLWELWAQQQTPERSADSFLAACRTRLRAERQGESFLADLKKRIPRDSDAPEATTLLGGWWNVLRRPARFAWAASVMLAAFAVFLWLLTPHDARATTTLHGELVCTACILHQTHEHLPAIRVHEGATTRIYYLQPIHRPIQPPGDFCAAPIPMVATGKVGTKNGRLLFDVQAVEPGSPPLSPPANPDERVLFPF
jgi:hypothetical protein